MNRLDDCDIREAKIAVHCAGNGEPDYRDCRRRYIQGSHCLYSQSEANFFGEGTEHENQD